MRLYLLRHADASPGTPDHLRELTSKGLDSLETLAGFLKNKNLVDVAEIRHSPLVRARQTAEHFKKLSGLQAPLREVPLLEPYDDFRILAEIVNTSASNLLLVGHQPNLGMLASYLLTRDSRIDLFNLKKCGFMCIEKIEGIDPGSQWDSSWQLRWVVVPRLLKKK